MGDHAALRVRFGADEGGDVVAQAERDLAGEVVDLRSREDVTGVTISESGIGAGASGPAFEVAIEFARAMTDDATRLATLGGWVLWLVEQVRKRRGKAGPMIEDGPTLGAVAAARVAPTLDLTGYRFSVCRPLTADADGLGTDERFAWVASFIDDPGGKVLAVFMSPTGKRLGQVLVPIEAYSDGEHWFWRTQEEIDDVFRSLNGQE